MSAIETCPVGHRQVVNSNYVPLSKGGPCIVCGLRLVVTPVTP